MRNFDGELAIQYDRHASNVLNGDYYRVLKSFRYYTNHSRTSWAFVPAGMLTDLGSIPKAFRGIVDNDGKAAQAYVLHDQLCEYLSITAFGKPQIITRKRADEILRLALLDLEVDGVTANWIYRTVRAYAEMNGIRKPSTSALKRTLEAQFNFEDLQ